MEVIKAGNASELLYEAVHRVLYTGQKVSPRGLETYELSPATLILYDPTDPIPSGINRARLHPPIGVAEGLSDVAGWSMPALLTKIAPNFAAFLNSSADFDGAYGPRMQEQLDAAYLRLKADPNSRQAAVAVWDVRDALRDSSKDYPCTLGLHFLIRHDTLDLHVRMRSNDVWWGTPYDVMQFTMVQCSMANALEVSVGTYYHVANSLHIYERDYEAAEQLFPEPRIHQKHQYLDGVGREGMDWKEIRTRARDLLVGKHLMDATASELYYAEQLRPFMPDEVRIMPLGKPV